MDLKTDHGVDKLLICLVLLLVPAVIAQLPPGSPVITSSKERIEIGDIITLTCTSKRGVPAPSVKWYRGENEVSSLFNTVGDLTTNTYTFTASNQDQFAVYECRVFNNVLQNPLTNTIFIIVYAPLEVNAPRVSYSVQTSNSVTLQCVVTGTATAIYWYKSNQLLQIATNNRLSGASVQTPSLTISNVALSDGGEYVCSATNGYDTKRSSNIVLSVQAPLTVIAPSTLYSPMTSTSVTLTCRVTSGTATDIKWYKDDQQLLISLNSRYSGGSVGSPSLLITNVQLRDGGKYICSGSDGSATRNTTTMTLSPKATPSQPILVGPQSVTAGSSNTWTCTSTGAFPAQTMAVRIGNDLFTNELTTNSLFESFAGSYRVVGRLAWAPSMEHNQQIMYCDVFHPQTLNSKQTASMQLTVRSGLSITAPRTFYNPAETETVTLACIVTAGNPTGISWKHDNINVIISGKMSGGTISNPALRISNVDMSDAGTYVCEATDGSATVRTNNIQLSPIEKPVSEFDIITTILKGYNRFVRPIDPVVRVTHSLIPKEMVKFDHEMLAFDALQCITWNDPRLSWPRGQPRVSLPSSIIWLPDIVMLGQKFTKDFEDKAIIKKNGDVTYCPESMIMSKHCEGMAGNVWECEFKLVSWSYDKVMLDIFFPIGINVPAIDTSMYYEHEEYEIVSKCANRREKTYPCRVGTYPELTYTFVIRRRQSYCRDLTKNPTCNS
ncbi:hemicentin-1-like isoform X2 [Mytilus trossulus]|uniref:hemicentin-1-like isoform X2 n=1 Tax=Mytilus trossulus TaxID=6551 RepID=UPI0030053885